MLFYKCITALACLWFKLARKSETVFAFSQPIASRETGERIILVTIAANVMPLRRENQAYLSLVKGKPLLNIRLLLAALHFWQPTCIVW